jgi:hypothetical protein
MTTPYKPSENYPGFDRDLDLDGVQVKNVGDPTDDQDVATKAYVDPLIRKAVVILTAAEIKALNATPKTLIAAPGAGQTLVVERCVFRFLWGTIQYTGGSALSVIHSGGSTNLLAGTLAASFLTTPTAAVTDDAILAGLGTQLSAPQATAVKLKAAGAEFATGDSTLEVSLFYRLIPATA